jgi:hypothetical protein
MSEREPRDREPLDESDVRVRRASAYDWLDDMRAARGAERAPDDVRERLLERARELGQSVEGRAPSLPLGIEPALGLGLLEEGPLAGRSRAARSQADRLLAEAGPLAAWTHPLLARIAGAGLMIGLVVLVIADARRPSASALPAMSADAIEPEPPAAASPVRVAPAVSDRAPSAEPAAGDSPSESPDLLATAPAPGDVHSGPSSLAQRVARALLISTLRPAGQGTEDPRPATSLAISLPELPRPRDATPPWPSPQAALSAIRAVTGPYLEGASSYPRGTRVVARGNIRAEPGHNFITNGDFSRGAVMWSVRSWRGFGDTSVAAYYSVQTGALCTAVERNGQGLGGWPWDDRRLSPSSFDLERGKRYRLSLRAWSTGSERVQLVVKVGHQKPPYTPALVTKVPIGAEPGLFEIDFVAAHHDTSAGFAFVATNPVDRSLSAFCIDDVSVRPIDADP